MRFGHLPVFWLLFTLFDPIWWQDVRGRLSIRCMYGHTAASGVGSVLAAQAPAEDFPHMCRRICAGVFVFCLTYLTFCIYLAAEQPGFTSSGKRTGSPVGFRRRCPQGRPLPELKERLDLAASLLYKNDSAVCIVSGGQQPP